MWLKLWTALVQGSHQEPQSLHNEMHGSRHKSHWLDHEDTHILAHAGTAQFTPLGQIKHEPCILKFKTESYHQATKKNQDMKNVNTFQVNLIKTNFLFCFNIKHGNAVPISLSKDWVNGCLISSYMVFHFPILFIFVEDKSAFL